MSDLLSIGASGVRAYQTALSTVSENIANTGNAGYTRRTTALSEVSSVNGGLNADGSVAAYDFQTSYPSNASPTLALLLTRMIEPLAQAFEMGDRTARPPYDYANLRVAVNDMAPMVRASWLRGVSALPN